VINRNRPGRHTRRRIRQPRKTRRRGEGVLPGQCRGDHGGGNGERGRVLGQDTVMSGFVGRLGGWGQR
jgi:hypothetical protein